MRSEVKPSANSENPKQSSLPTVGYGIFFVIMVMFLSIILVFGHLMPSWSLGIGIVVISCLIVMVVALLDSHKGLD